MSTKKIIYFLFQTPQVILMYWAKSIMILCFVPGNPYWSGRLSTDGLLVLTSLKFELAHFYIEYVLPFYKISYLSISDSQHKWHSPEMTLSINNTQHNNALPLCWVWSCWVLRFIPSYAECRYAECHYAECHYAECRRALMLSRIYLYARSTIHNVGEQKSCLGRVFKFKLSSFATKQF